MSHHTFNGRSVLMAAFFSVLMKIGPSLIPHCTCGVCVVESELYHPFIEGNGRTARAACYYLICMKQGRILGGQKTVPERIVENRVPYIAGLQAADRAFMKKGQYHITELATYLEGLLKGQNRRHRQRNPSS